MFCSKCGTANVEANLFCASCGNSLKPTASVSPVAATSRRKTPLLLSIVALVCLGAWLAASPYITLWRLNTAVTNSDVETLNALVDWESVRAEVKSELATVIGVTTQPSDLSTSSSFVGLAATFLGNAAVGMAVDTFVTAENMVQLSAGQLPVPDLSGFGVLGDALATGIQGATAGQFDDVKAELTSRVDYSTGYTSPMAFEVRISVNKTAAGRDFDNPEDNTLLPVARILMRRSGLGWTVQGVQFAAEVQNLIKTAQNDTSTTSPVTLPERGIRRQTETPAVVASTPTSLKTGTIVVNPQFDDARAFSDGLAAVSIGDKWGFIDKTGSSSIRSSMTWVTITTAAH